VANTTLTPNVAGTVFTGAAPGNWPSTGKLYVTELASLAQDTFAGGAQLAHFPSLVDQVVPFSAGIFALSLPFGRETRILRLHSDSVCSVNVGFTTANTSNMRLAANQTEYVAVKPQSLLAVISNT
jgi:hypothetical protein